jgi:oligoribonuclease NrnB/cAMP/cGMP phosphodiesterase (DHH superfamily)
MSKKLESKKKIVVLYHANCSDGFGAAWAAWKKFGTRADYIGIDPRTLPDKTLKNKEIYILDSAYPAQTLAKLKKRNKKVIVIDHHLSNKDDVKFASEYLFNLNHSGAVLAWQYFHPRKSLPRLLRHVEDFDLWRFRLSHTREFSAIINDFGFDFKIWNKLARDLENPKKRNALAQKGKLLLDYENKLIERIVKNAEVVNFMGYKTLAVNSPIFESEIGHYLYKKLPPTAIVWRVKNGKITVSLRSNGKVDVSKIAAKFGGGGHKAAAGFALKRDARLPWKFLKAKYEK